MKITLYPHRNGGGGFDNSHPQHRDLNFEEFCNLLQNECKKPAHDRTAGGAYVGGYDLGGKSKASIESRCIVALDFDDLKGTTQDEAFKTIHEQLKDYEYFAHTTYNSNPTAPRIRILLPLEYEITANDPHYDLQDVYSATVYTLALMVNPEWLDGTCAQINQCMYMPRQRPDGPDIVFYHNQGARVSPVTEKGQIREIRATFDRIRPLKAADQDAQTGSKGRKPANPLEKTGWVGAFCRTYGISEAIERYCSDYYRQDGADRYTWVNGHSEKGIKSYNDVLAYCYHNTAPIASIHDHNAFDLVRLTLFSHLDEGQGYRENTRPTDKASYKAMVELCKNDPAVVQQYDEDQMQHVRNVFGVEATDDDAWMKDLRLIGKTQQPDSNPHNIRLMLENLPALKGGIKYDNFSHRKVGLDLPWNDDVHQWEDIDTANTRIYLDEIMGRAASKDTIIDAIEATAHANAYDALQEYINHLPEWDGVPRVDTLLIDYLGAEDDPAGYTRMVTRKHMVAHIARALVPACKYETMLILQGPQGCGKTSFVGNLAPAPEWYQNELPPLKDKDKDNRMLLNGKWILETAELVAFKKSDQEAFKNFLSLQWDEYRKPFGREIERHPRRCILWGTTNQLEFLRDSTGERRYWPVACHMKDSNKDPRKDLPKDRDQIWAEALHYYNEKESTYLDKQQEILLKQVQERFKESDPKLQQVIDFLETPICEDWNNLPLYEKRKIINGIRDDERHGLLPDKPLKLMQRNTITRRELWCECFGNDESTLNKASFRELQDLLENVPGWQRVNKEKRIYGYQVKKEKIYYQRAEALEVEEN